MTNPIPITLAPDQLASLADGGTTIFVRMEPQPDTVSPDGIAYVRSECMLDDHFDEIFEIEPPFTIGDTLVVREEWCKISGDNNIWHVVKSDPFYSGTIFADEWQPADTIPLWAARFKLTATTEPTYAVVGGVSGWQAGVEPQS